MEGGESVLDTLFDEEGIDDTPDIEMLDVEEGELIEDISKTELRESCDAGVNQECKEKNSRHKKKKRKNKRKRGNNFNPNITDINKFVIDACKRLRERKSYLMWNAVGCLGVSALSDLVKECLQFKRRDEIVKYIKTSTTAKMMLVNHFVRNHHYFDELLVDAIQACGGQKTADGKRFRNGGGILWNIIKIRDPNAYKEIMKKGKEFEKQFKQPNQEKQEHTPQTEVNKPNVSDDLDHPSLDQTQLEKSSTEPKRASVHERIRLPVSYDDLLEGEVSRDE